MEPFAKTLVGGVVIVSFGLAVFPAPAEPLPPGKDSPGLPADPSPVKPPTAPPAADTSQAAGQPFKLPGLTINSKDRCVDVEASVCLDGGTLELIACTKGSKEHESVIVVAARPIHIHTALLLLGAKNGSPARRQAIGDEEARWVDLPPKGDLIDVLLEIKDPAGKLTERPISDFITRSSGPAHVSGAVPTEGDKAPRFPSTFIFAGSQLIDSGPGPKTYLAERSGHVISIATFGDEMLCLPEVHSQDNGALMWSIDPTHLPKKGTPVTLRLRLKKAPEPKPTPKP
ncbi:MAG: hypothetical protein CFE26_08855 [Verrucomicrobiales bacterium VVV1]|nr:MAG: hypothetical protein CFE26_08855 [Verrucomicrobiales bacterium VVV1]